MKCQKRNEYPIECLFEFSPNNIVIPLDWTPEQAENIVSTMQLIEEKIWSIHGDIIIARYRENCLIDQHIEAEAQSQHVCLDEDDIPF